MYIENGHRQKTQPLHIAKKQEEEKTADLSKTTNNQWKWEHEGLPPRNGQWQNIYRSGLNQAVGYTNFTLTPTCSHIKTNTEKT